MVPSQNLEYLAVDGLGGPVHEPLEMLECRVTRMGPEVVSKHLVLRMYLQWLQTQVMNGTVAQDSSTLLKSWVQSLATLGFDENHIFRSFQSWKRRESQADPSTLRRFLIIEQDLQKLFERRPLCSSPNDPGSNASLLRSNKENTRISSEEQSDDQRRRGPQRSGANDLPVGKRRTRAPGPTHEIIEIREDSPSELPVLSRPSTPANLVPFSCIFPDRLTSSDDTDEVIFTRETILLDTPPENTFIPMGYTSGTPYSEVMHDQPPPSSYICKRCDRGGHWIHLCPTNMDPRMDQPPARTYKCKICNQTGLHFATLCPLNRNEWSLTQQRKRLGIAENPQPPDRYRDGRRDSSRSRSIDSRHTRDSPRSRHGVSVDSHPRRRDNRSRSPIRSFRDQSRERYLDGYSLSPVTGFQRQLRGIRRRSPSRGDRKLPDSYRPGPHVSRPQKSQKYRPRHSRPVRNDRDHPSNKGRLYYEDDPFSTPLGSPSDVNMGEDVHQAPPPRAPALTETHGQTLVIRTKVAAEAEFLEKIRVEAAAEADEFLKKLQAEVEEGIHDDCASVLSDIIGKVCYYEDRNLFEDERGILHQRVTNPPYGVEVARLFSHRPNPVICLRPKRPTAADFKGDSTS